MVEYKPLYTKEEIRKIELDIKNKPGLLSGLRPEEARGVAALIGQLGGIAERWGSISRKQLFEIFGKRKTDMGDLVPIRSVEKVAQLLQQLPGAPARRHTPDIKNLPKPQIGGAPQRPGSMPLKPWKK